MDKQLKKTDEQHLEEYRDYFDEKEREYHRFIASQALKRKARESNEKKAKGGSSSARESNEKKAKGSSSGNMKFIYFLS
ncbi:hypothetical protein AVEN_128232-1 [Araneus ventricosus]|uniref:Uncharacterized protein n=1 Tax=Araneus ventricosus TaxID=182803 RepID=A0A4Y2A0K2_ARAVE|nr:hypothetical protein AVEN_128232-1 [Araneus ventricosus]